MSIEEWITTQELTRVRPLSSLDNSDPAKPLAEYLRLFLAKFQAGEYRVDQSFHRLCGRVVIAVLQTRDGAFFEGINTEMSIVTGSICAERAAIVHARSRRPFLKIEDLAAVACITIPEDGKDRNPLWPCGVCMEWVQKIQAKQPEFRMYAFSSILMETIVERRTAALSTRSDSLVVRPGRVSGSYRKILELFADSEHLTSREVKRLLPWVRKWWLRDLQQRGLLEEVEEEKWTISPDGASQLQTYPASPSNKVLG